MDVKRGDVFFINTPRPVEGHVQGGRRPWVVVQNDVGNRYSDTTLVVPLTTKFKRLNMPTHCPVSWGPVRSGVVECEQVRVIDIKNDWKYIATLPEEVMTHIDRALYNAFFFKSYEKGAGDDE